jgi:hypothetical protein
VALALLCSLTVFAQATRVTILTTDGERVEGVLKGASGTEFVLDVQGAERKITTASVAQLIVVPLSPLRSAFVAFEPLLNALSSGSVNRENYNVYLAKAEGAAGFANGSGGWADIRMAMRSALTEYQDAATKDGWDKRDEFWRRAHFDLMWAAELEKRDANTPGRIEDPTPRPLRIGQQVRGRLGVGDRQMTKAIDATAIGAFNDLWGIELRGSATVVIEMSSNVLTPRVTLLDESDRVLASETAEFSHVTLRRRLTTGAYRIMAGTSKASDVGTYTLMVTIRR